jgi:hypothetical protein
MEPEGSLHASKSAWASASVAQINTVHTQRPAPSAILLLVPGSQDKFLPSGFLIKILRPVVSEIRVFTAARVQIMIVMFWTWVSLSGDYKVVICSDT